MRISKRLLGANYKTLWSAIRIQKSGNRWILVSHPDDERLNCQDSNPSFICRRLNCCGDPLVSSIKDVRLQGRDRRKNICSIFDKTFLSKGFSITGKYAFSNEILYNFFARHGTKKIKA